MHSPEETIAALSTPPGRGGIAVIRVTGPEALSITQRVFVIRSSGQIQPRQALFGTFRSPSAGSHIDEGFLTYHEPGRSFTGEALVELSCHGSPAVVGLILEGLLAAGARAANPGEFTYRAVLNGRIDLAQAEGIRDLINAPTPTAAAVAASQVRGALSQRLEHMREELLSLTADGEARLEFGEEPDVQSLAAGGGPRLAALTAELESFLGSYRQGKWLRDGARVVLAGRPNAGKSTLFNALLRSDRAIVSDLPGTTRDYLAESLDLRGIPVRLVDTAGLRRAESGVEAEGVRRSHAETQSADLVLLLLPRGEPIAEQDKLLMSQIGERIVRVISKSDLQGSLTHGSPGSLPHGSPGSLPDIEGIEVSAQTGAGLEHLRGAIFSRLAGAESLVPGELIITEARHHAALRRALERLAAARAAVEAGLTEEIWLADLHAAQSHIGEITGRVTMEDVYDRIFSSFCVGK